MSKHPFTNVMVKSKTSIHQCRAMVKSKSFTQPTRSYTPWGSKTFLLHLLLPPFVLLHSDLTHLVSSCTLRLLLPLQEIFVRNVISDDVNSKSYCETHGMCNAPFLRLYWKQCVLSEILPGYRVPNLAFPLFFALIFLVASISILYFTFLMYLLLPFSFHNNELYKPQIFVFFMAMIH